MAEKEANIKNTDQSKVSEKRFSWDKVKKSTRLFSYIKPYRSYFIIGMVFLILSSAVFMIFPQAAGEMANTAMGKKRFNLNLQQYGLLFLGILILQGLFSYFRTICFAVVSEKGMADLRKQVFDKIAGLSVVEFEQHKVGELTSRMTTDIEKMQSAISITLAEFIRQFVILIIGLAILFWVAPKLSLIMLLCVPFCVISAYFFGRYIRKLSRTRQDKIADANSIAEEVLNAFQTVKAFTNEWYEARRYDRSVDEIVTVSLKFAKIRGLFFIFIITILFGGIFFILWRGAILVQNGEMGGGDLFSFIIYTGLIGGAIAGIGSLFTQLLGAMGATERVFELLDKDIEIDSFKKTVDLSQYEKMDGAIEINNAYFNYPSRPEVGVLKGISLNILPGQKVALVGSSGAGKSTIVQLLLNNYQLNSGEIKIDGKNIYDIEVQNLRNQISIVPQDVVLFGTSIRENILYGKLDASDAELFKAAELSNSLEFINQFPDGFETMVGERGVKLSGGQKQRIAIARAIIKDPSILILDEATSSLDAESEKLVQEALDRVMEGRTSIIIAHRLSTIKSVDEIYVLEKGRIAESGSHDLLFQNKESLYYSLAKLQFEA